MTPTMSSPASLGGMLLLLGATLACAACGGGDASSRQQDGGSTGGLARSGPGGTPGELNQAAAGEDGGTMSFSLDRGVSLSLPITFCGGFGTVLTVAAHEGEMQADTRIVESPVMRGDAPLEDSASSSFRFSGEQDGRRYEELWTSRKHVRVLRDGQRTRVEGTMTGQRFYAISDTAFGPGEPVDGEREYAFTLEALCAG